MEIIQSFVYSISRVKLSLYEQRILVKVVEYAQSRVQGMLIRDNMAKLDHDFDNVKMVIPIKDILSDGSQHYDQVRAAARALMTRQFDYVDSATNNWVATPLIFNASHDHRSGCIKFYVSRTLFDAILDFTKGFRQYSLETALSLASPYASRLYSLMCGQRSPITFKISELKKMFGVEDKYSQTADFIKKVIVPSQKCLDKARCTSFTFSRVKEGQKVSAIMFHPILRDEKSPSQVTAKAPVGVFVDKEIRIMLVTQGGFSNKELSAHKPLLSEFCHVPDALAVLADIVNRYLTNRKTKGWVINAIKGEVQEQRNRTASSSAQSK